MQRKDKNYNQLEEPFTNWSNENNANGNNSQDKSAPTQNTPNGDAREDSGSGLVLTGNGQFIKPLLYTNHCLRDWNCLTILTSVRHRRAACIAEKLAGIGKPQSLPRSPRMSPVESLKIMQKWMEDEANCLIDEMKWLFHTELKSLM